VPLPVIDRECHTVEPFALHPCEHNCGVQPA
jgi:hypothetical protein